MFVIVSFLLVCYKNVCFPSCRVIPTFSTWKNIFVFKKPTFVLFSKMPNHITLHDGQGKLPGSADFTYKGTIECLLDYCFFHDFDYFLVVMKKSAGKFFLVYQQCQTVLWGLPKNKLGEKSDMCNKVSILFMFIYGFTRREFANSN